MRLVSTGSIIVGVPCASAFALDPILPRPLQQPHPQPARPRSRNEVFLANPPSIVYSSTSRESQLNCCRGGYSESLIPRRRPWQAARVASSTSITAARDRLALESLDLYEEKSNFPCQLRFVIIGANAKELGLRLADRYGIPVRSIEELMRGRRGRKTDLVMAKAASQWLEAEGPVGAILTGFPTTPAQAQSLEEQGVGVDRLIAINKNSEGHEPSNADVYDAEVLVRYEGRAVEVMDQGHFDALLDSAAPHLISSPGNLDVLGAEPVGTAYSSPLSVRESEETRDQSFGRKEGWAPTRDTTLEGQESDGAQGSCSQSVRDSIKSPQGRTGDQESDTSAHNDVGRASKVGAELKRAQKEAVKRKKKEANEAQRLDTPFYIAVAQGKPKARYRPPVPTIPSRITDRISSAVDAPEGAAGASSTRLKFGPLVLESPASDCLLASRITEPTGIQHAGMEPILKGESVILHAMTGSGKTLAFLLPLMERWAPSFALSSISADEGVCSTARGANGPDNAFRVILALPTRELAVQVAREAVLLAGGVTASVELLVDSGASHDLSKVTAPIVVGSAKLLERLIRKSHPSVREEVLSRVESIVVDEVDRLVDVLPKNAPPKEAEKRKRHARPIAALLERVIQTKPDVQIVACSATIGRPLRRELAHIIRRSSALRSTSEQSDAGEGNGQRPELRVIRASQEESSAGDLSTERAVPIPETIRHYCIPLRDGDFFSRLEALAGAIRELQPRRPLIFVPPEERVTAVVAHLRRNAGDIGRRAVALHEAMGFGSDEAASGVWGSHTSEAIQQHDKLARQLGGDTSMQGIERTGDEGLLAGAGVKRLRGEESGAILVTGEDSARGLHFDDVDFVFLMKRPKTPDEYVHLAGRTGRQGKTGSVVSLVPFEEFRKLQAWSSTLKVYFEPLELGDVMRR